MEIKELLGEEYTEKFKVYFRETLFEPTWGNLLEDRCPLCGCRLYEARNRPIWYCKSVKHKSRYFIHKDRLQKIKDNDKIKERKSHIKKHLEENRNGFV